MCTVTSCLDPACQHVAALWSELNGRTPLVESPENYSLHLPRQPQADQQLSTLMPTAASQPLGAASVQLHTGMQWRTEKAGIHAVGTSRLGTGGEGGKGCVAAAGMRVVAVTNVGRPTLPA